MTKDLRVLNYHAVSLVYARQRGGSVDRGPLKTGTAFEAAFFSFYLYGMLKILLISLHYDSI